MNANQASQENATDFNSGIFGYKFLLVFAHPKCLNNQTTQTKWIIRSTISLKIFKLKLQSLPRRVGNISMSSLEWGKHFRQAL